MLRIVAIASAAAMLASTASAQSSVTNWANANYDVTGSAVGENPNCLMSSSFAVAGRADIEFALLLNEERAIFSLTSRDWSAVHDQEYEGFAYYFPQSQTLYDGGVTLGYVFRYSEKGFSTLIDLGFLDNLAAENRLVVVRQPDVGDLVVVADLDLTGTAAAVAALRRCVAYVTDREAARLERERRNDYIAKDPFQP